MTMHKMFAMAALVAAAAPTFAGPTIYDSGAPSSGNGFGMALSSIDWLADEVRLDAGTTIGGVSTFLAGAQPGETFTVALYADRVKSGGVEIPDTRDGGLLYSTQVTFGADGWNGVSGLDWQVAAGGNYWVAVQVVDGDTLAATDDALLPVGAPNAPLAVAFTDSASGRFQPLGTSSAPYAFGLRLSSAVPEPATWMAMMAGLLVLAARRRRA